MSFNPNNATSKSVAAGYYSGGTLNSTTAYNSGRTQGQNDVKASPGSYGLESGGSYNNGYNKGVADADGRANSSSANYKAGYDKGLSDGKAAAKHRVTLKFNGWHTHPDDEAFIFTANATLYVDGVAVGTTRSVDGPYEESIDYYIE